MRQPTKLPASSRQREYARLCAQLADTGWISEGYVQDRGAGGGSPCYPWTRKVKGKTVCVALSKEQYEWLKQAIANWRRVQQILRQMCSGLAERNSLNVCLAPHGARNSAKGFSDSCKGPRGSAAGSRSPRMPPN